MYLSFRYSTWASEMRQAYIMKLIQKTSFPPQILEKYQFPQSLIYAHYNCKCFDWISFGVRVKTTLNMPKQRKTGNYNTGLGPCFNQSFLSFWK